MFRTNQTQMNKNMLAATLNSEETVILELCSELRTSKTGSSIAKSR